jgi:hypothetical protein
MTQEEWKNIYTVFKDTFDEYYLTENDYYNGKNQAVRNSGKRKMDVLRGRIRNYVGDNYELWELIEFPDEMFTFQWFGRGFRKLLGKIKEKMQ